MFCYIQDTLSKCPSEMRPVTSPVNTFAETASPVPNYVSLTNKYISFLCKEDLSLLIFRKIGSPQWNRIFLSMVLGLWTNFATSL